MWRVARACGKASLVRVPTAERMPRRTAEAHLGERHACHRRSAPPLAIERLAHGQEGCARITARFRAMRSSPEYDECSACLRRRQRWSWSPRWAIRRRCFSPALAQPDPSAARLAFGVAGSCGSRAHRRSTRDGNPRRSPRAHRTARRTAGSFVRSVPVTRRINADTGGQAEMLGPPHERFGGGGSEERATRSRNPGRPWSKKGV